MTATADAITEILDFWFADCRRDPVRAEEMNERWFDGGTALDGEIQTRFAEQMKHAAGGELDEWGESPRGKLALILLLDQFPRNVHRGTARAFAQDDRAARLAIDLIKDGLEQLAPIEQVFALMPLMHCENLERQDAGIAGFDRCVDDAADAWKPILERSRNFAQRHRDVIARFGRFPHRNRVLGRESTDDEARYLSDGGETWGQ